MGKAIGGASAGERLQAPRGRDVRLRRALRKDRAALGSGPTVSLRVPSSQQPVGYWEAAHYTDVRNVGLKIMRQYPPDSHYYVAVGRSPVAIASFFRELNPEMSMTFPASDMRLEIRPEWKQHYFDHFAHLIPQEVLKGDRTIVLFDRSRAKSGTSLSRLKGYLQEYLQSIGSSVRVKAVGLSPRGPLAQGVEHMSTGEHPNVFKYDGRTDHDEGVAPFLRKHRIGAEPLEAIQPNPNHKPFVKGLRERMKQDQELDQILGRELGHLLEKDKSSKDKSSKDKSSKDKRSKDKRSKDKRSKGQEVEE